MRIFPFDPEGMFKNRKLWLLAAVCIPTFLFLALAFSLYFTISEYVSTFSSLRQTHQILHKLSRVHILIKSLESEQRGYLLTGEEGYAASFRRYKENVFLESEILKKMISYNPEQVLRVEYLVDILKSKVFLLEENMDYRSKSKGKILPSSTLMNQNEREMEKLDKVILEIRENEVKLLEERRSQALSNLKKQLMLTSVTVCVFLFFLILSLFLVWRLGKLQSLVTVCSMTHKVLYEKQWLTLEEYLEKRFGLNVSHGISHDAAQKIIEDIRASRKGNPNATS